MSEGVVGAWDRVEAPKASVAFPGRPGPPGERWLRQGISEGEKSLH